MGEGAGERRGGQRCGVIRLKCGEHRENREENHQPGAPHQETGPEQVTPWLPAPAGDTPHRHRGGSGDEPAGVPAQAAPQQPVSGTRRNGDCGTGI